jgi:4'-phosphopantetheinyl transferase
VNGVIKTPSIDLTPEAPMTTFSPQEIHVWLSFCDDPLDPSLSGAYRRLLSTAEQTQETRFHAVTDRRRFLLTRTLVRTVLGRYLAIAPVSCEFSANPYGRPEIINPAARRMGLRFNLSHTPELIALAVCVNRSLGVDVENVLLHETSLELAERYLSKDEAAALAALPAALRRERFFEYWTLKESYIKAMGMGLSLPLDQFSFHLSDDDSVSLTVHGSSTGLPCPWQFWQYRLRDHYVLALCAERTESLPRIRVMQVTPLLRAAELQVTPSRLSPISYPNHC